MRNNMNFFSILTLAAIFFVFIAQIIALSTDYWSKTEVLNSTITVSFLSKSFLQLSRLRHHTHHATVLDPVLCKSGNEWVTKTFTGIR